MAVVTARGCHLKYHVYVCYVSVLHFLAKDIKQQLLEYENVLIFSQQATSLVLHTVDIYCHAHLSKQLLIVLKEINGIILYV